MDIIAVALFWGLAVWAFVSRGPVLLYLYFGSIPFGSTAVIPTQLTGDLTIVPLWIVVVLLIFRTFVTRDGPNFYLNSALRANRLALLAGYLLVAVLVTIFMPRLFRDEVIVVPMRSFTEGYIPLAPSAANISQLAYVLFSGLAVFAFARVLRTRSDRQHALHALCLGALVLAITGFVDFLSFYFSPFKVFLDSLRTASYAWATEVSIMGGRRVVGMMPEASAFGLTTLSFLSALVFFRRAIADSRVRNVYAPILIGALALLVYLSTSSGSLVGLGLLLCVVGAEALLRAFSRGKSGHIYRQDVVGEVSVIFAMFSIAGILLVLSPETLQPIYELIDKMVLSKPDSDSYAERGEWREIAYNSLLATHGLGVGVGSTRASSTVVAVLSNTGVLGALLLFGFILQTLIRSTRHLPWEGQAMMSAYRFSFIAPFAVSTMVGGVQLSGIQMFSFGLAVAVMTSREARYAKFRYGREAQSRNYIRITGQPVPQLAPPKPQAG